MLMHNLIIVFFVTSFYRAECVTNNIKDVFTLRVLIQVEIEGARRNNV
jgi:hypothetical protein